MLASPGPWRLGVAVPVALWSRSPQTAAELARSESIRFYSIQSSSTGIMDMVMTWWPTAVALIGLTEQVAWSMATWTNILSLSGRWLSVKE